MENNPVIKYYEIFIYLIINKQATKLVVIVDSGHKHIFTNNHHNIIKISLIAGISVPKNSYNFSHCSLVYAHWLLQLAVIQCDTCRSKSLVFVASCSEMTCYAS